MEELLFTRKYNKEEYRFIVMALFNMDDLTEGAQFKVYPVDGYGERIAYVKPVIFDREDLDW